MKKRLLAFLAKPLRPAELQALTQALVMDDQDGLHQVLAMRPDLAGPRQGQCMICGCIDFWACPGGSSWANRAHTLCDSCIPSAPPRRRAGLVSSLSAKGGEA